MNSQKVVTPVKTGVQGNRNCLNFLDSGFRRNDENVHMRTFCETINLDKRWPCRENRIRKQHDPTAVGLGGTAANGARKTAEARGVREEANAGPMPKKKLLIADDSRCLHEVYTRCLGDEFEYLHAYDGADALIMAVAELPDLIVLDLMMPLLDGRSICRKLKSYPRTKDIKIVIVTAKDSQSDRLVGFEVGADDYIDKLCSMELLVRSVKKQLD